MLKRLSIWTLMFVLVAAWVEAQQPPDAPPGWNGDVAAGFSLTSGNSDTTTISLSATANRRLSSRFEWLNGVSYLYGENADVKSADLFNAGSRLNWTHSDRFFSFYELQFLRDEFKDFDQRWSPAGGVGYKLYRTPDRELAVLGGLAAIITKYHSTDETDSYAAFKLGDQFIWKLSETSELKQLLDFTSDVSELDRFFIHFETSVSAALTKRLALKVAFIDNYDNQPVTFGIEKNDVIFIASLSMKY